MKYAIVMLIFNNEYYVPGSIISAHAHKKYMEKLNLDFDLVVMVDEKIYQYKNELLKFFDVVKKIDMLELKLNYHVLKKYSKWMKYLINKWQVLQYDEYDKILFVDPDFLPMDDKFYNIFNLNTPAILTKKCNLGEELKKNFFMNEEYIEEIKNLSAENYYNVAPKLKASMNATIVLLEPDKNLYNEYLEFIKKAEIKGYESLLHSAVDETSLLLFMRFYKNVPVYCISKEYSIAPWDNKGYDLNNIYGLNYVSLIKPWMRFPMLQWPEENIWHVIAKKALCKSEKITELYVNGLIENLKNFANNYKKIDNKSGYNLESLKIQKEKVLDLIKYVKRNNELKFQNKKDALEIQKIMNDAQNIHSFMNKKSIINYNNLLKLFEK